MIPRSCSLQSFRYIKTMGSSILSSSSKISILLLAPPLVVQIHFWKGRLTFLMTIRVWLSVIRPKNMTPAHLLILGFILTVCHFFLNQYHVRSNKSSKYNISLYETTQVKTDYTVASLNRTAFYLVAKNTLGFLIKLTNYDFRLWFLARSDQRFCFITI